ncbi:hypothetical protein XF35_40055 [Streptomyces platensis subsp. clarensis]|uniref:Uncharacterized protein n=1 Tax=Streptomyces showdoensis TaxID=68268 RepID=A0A2P2GKN9_STREW|nr:hypothetical protein [Streptomyces showdoensis]KKZ72081.1 hypothetical protein VO63_20065 [Streptomyces showdoensis]MCW7991236.1 hypothetical protein [Streptomyces platensis subsp. clarensis]
MSEVFLRLLPHCPKPVEVEDRVGDRTYVAEVCGCPVERGPATPVHWLLEHGREMHCPHGPRHPVLFTTTGRPMLKATAGGTACASCAAGLYSHHRVRRLDVDVLCCYCGGPAEAGDGWYLKTHPALGVPGARR